MTCSSFGKCGSCVLYDMSYEDEVQFKAERLRELFCDFDMPTLEIFRSKEAHFRARAEFRIWHEGDKSYYAMFGLDKKIITIDECNIVDEAISDIMQPLLDEITKNEFLRHKLYAIEFLSNVNKELIITLIYHKKWQEEQLIPHIQHLKTKFPHTDYVLRRKGKKVFVDKNYLIETLHIKEETYQYKIIESTFTQPNRYINQQMIRWAMDNSEDLEGDLVEMYCGHGNFTIPLSKRFNKVIATEISPQSIQAALFNAQLNHRDNITFLAMSAAEFARLRSDDSVLLAKYNLQNILIDPPRAGLDDKSREFTNSFENIIYISCNPQTLKRDLEVLSQDRDIKAFAFFDQFPWTNHIECGVVLSKHG
ncbi:MAG: tRNA (uridine(54)-C5)-methyltransferase TrmA [Epsilonproteobacteria bacterium]|nr:tRNA (uridine(54)-C5)-methyltransferase TrmA [Campylobacterota bacterium]